MTIVYPKAFPNWLHIVIKQHDLPNRHVQLSQGVMLYRDDHLIGVNVKIDESIQPTLTFGIYRQLHPSLKAWLLKQLPPEVVAAHLNPYQSHFVYGTIIEKVMHPDANALWICQVDLGEKIIQVVTNQAEVQVQSIVVCATEGALTAAGVMIEPTMMMKQKTEAMFCSSKTLGLVGDYPSGILTFPEQEHALGKDFFHDRT